MKKLLLTFAFALTLTGVQAQTLSGTFIITRTVKIKIDVDHGGEGRPKMPEQFESDLELLFANNKSMLRPAPEPEEVGSEGPGMGRMMRMMGADAETFCDYKEGKVVSRHEVGDKFYVVNDTFVRRDWKITNETKEILGHPCRKALTNRTITRMEMKNDNGEFTRVERTDTVPVEAWYAEDIPVPAGPAEFNGSLPGMILEMTFDGGKVHFLATDYRKNYEKKALVAPEGEVITQDELKAKRQEFFKQFGPPRGHGPR